MSRTAIKREIHSSLSKPLPFSIPDNLWGYELNDLVNPLFAAICRADTCTRWNGIYTLGKVIGEITAKDLEAGRVLMRRFLWSLNDESGGIGWGAPETMAEAMINHQQLCEEYLHMLVSYTQGDGPDICQDGNYLELPELQRGLLWGLSRVIDHQASEFERFDFINDLADYLNSDDKTVRALAIRCLCGLDQKELVLERAGKKEDWNDLIDYYYMGEMTGFTINELISNHSSQFFQNQKISDHSLASLI